ncbi:unnamed protein product [Hapterophycus canaliculatus]
MSGGDCVAEGGVGDGGGGIWVPWETEAANASPDNLKWTPGGSSVTAVLPGL